MVPWPAAAEAGRFECSINQLQRPTEALYPCYPVWVSLHFWSTVSVRRYGVFVDWQVFGGSRIEFLPDVPMLLQYLARNAEFSRYPVLISLHFCSAVSVRRCSVLVDWQMYSCRC